MKIKLRRLQRILEHLEHSLKIQMQAKNNNKNQLDIWLKVSQKSHPMINFLIGLNQIRSRRKAVYRCLKRAGQEPSLIGILTKREH